MKGDSSIWYKTWKYVQFHLYFFNFIHYIRNEDWNLLKYCFLQFQLKKTKKTCHQWTCIIRNAKYWNIILGRHLDPWKWMKIIRKGNCPLNLLQYVWLFKQKCILLSVMIFSICISYTHENCNLRIDYKAYTFYMSWYNIKYKHAILYIVIPKAFSLSPLNITQR